MFRLVGGPLYVFVFELTAGGEALVWFALLEEICWLKEM